MATSDCIVPRLLLTGQGAEVLIFCMRIRHSFDSSELRFEGFVGSWERLVDGAYWGDSPGNGTSFWAIFGRPRGGEGTLPHISWNSREMCML